MSPENDRESQHVAEWMDQLCRCLAAPGEGGPVLRMRSSGPRRRLPEVTGQEFSELREGHVLRDETLTATGEAFLRGVANDVAALGYRLEVASAAALLARHLDGDSWLD
jgi:hypothetical protein